MVVGHVVMEHIVLHHVTCHCVSPFRRNLRQTTFCSCVFSFLQVPAYYTVCAPPPSTVMFHKNHTAPVGILHLSIHAAAG